MSTPPRRAADDYEKKFMAGSGDVLHREKTIWKMHWLLLFGPIVTLVGAGLVFAGVGSKPAPMAVGIALVPLALLQLALWATFITLRLTVTSREVVVQYGFFGPRIPLDAIDLCEAQDIPELRFGGGIKRVRGAWAYTLFGHGTRAVMIEWRDRAGKKQKTIVSSPDPDALVLQIRRARGGVRVDVEDAAVAEEVEDGEEKRSQQRG